MPKAQQHYNQIRHNKAFLQSFTSVGKGTTAYPDWSLTILFYSALHFIELYLARRKNQHCISHAERNRVYCADPQLKVIYNDYKRLDDWSRDARYGCAGPTFTPMDVLDGYKRFNRIEAYITSVLTPQSPPPAAPPSH